LARTSKPFVQKEPDSELIDLVAEGCHAVQMLSCAQFGILRCAKPASSSSQAQWCQPR